MTDYNETLQDDLDTILKDLEDDMPNLGLSELSRIYVGALVTEFSMQKTMAAIQKELDARGFGLTDLALNKRRH